MGLSGHPIWFLGPEGCHQSPNPESIWRVPWVSTGAGLADLRRFSQLCFGFSVSLSPGTHVWAWSLAFPSQSDQWGWLIRSLVSRIPRAGWEGLSPRTLFRAPQVSTTAPALPPTLSPAGDGPRAVQRLCPVFGSHLKLL